MITNTHRGFTLIELLVVIAIIGILSGVVLASITTTRDKSKDASIKSTLNNLMKEAELHFAIYNSYTGIFSGTYPKFTDFLNSLTGETTSSAGGYWAVYVPLVVQNQAFTGSGIDYWCVDGRNNSKLEASPMSGSPQFCP